MCALLSVVLCYLACEVKVWQGKTIYYCPNGTAFGDGNSRIWVKQKPLLCGIQFGQEEEAVHFSGGQVAAIIIGVLLSLCCCCVCVCVDGCYRLTPKSVFVASVNDRAGSSDSHSSRVSVSPSSSCLRARVDWQSSQCSRVCASSSHGQLGLTLGSIRLAYALRCLECPARNWASKVASALDFT